jgi:hypothetical protein
MTLRSLASAAHELCCVRSAAAWYRSGITVPLCHSLSTIFLGPRTWSLAAFWKHLESEARST